MPPQLVGREFPGRFCSPLCGVAGLDCECGQEGMGEDRQGDVPVPADVAADLVLIEATLVLRRLEALLDRSARAGDPDQRGQLDTEGCVAEVVGKITGIGQAAAGHCPAVMGGRIGVEDQVGGKLATAQSWTRGPLAPSPRDSHCQASAGAPSMSWSMRQIPARDLICWDLGTATTYRRQVVRADG